MRRNSSDLSFWILRPTETKAQLHMELPLLRQHSKQDIDMDYTHQINNITNEYKAKKKLTKINRLLHLYGQLTNKYKVVIHAQSIQLLLWNWFILLATFVNFVEIPIILLIVKDSYNQIYQNINFSIYYYSIMVILIFDMLIVRTRISYEQTGKHITNSEHILKYYADNFFIYDVVAIFSLILSSLPVKNIDYIKFIFFIKIVPLKEIDRQVKFKLLTRRHSIAIYQFLKLVFFIIFITNLYACIYFAIDYHYYNMKGEFYEKGYLWINGSFSLGNIDLLQYFGHKGAYIYALYWSLQTARTCGYGVASPKNYISILYTNIVMLNIVVIFVYFTNGVINIIITHGERRRKRLGVIRNFIDTAQQLHIQRQTKNKIIQQILFKNSQNEEFQQYLQNQLSETLKNEFKLTFQEHFIGFIQIFGLISQGNSYQFKISIAKIIKSKHYYKGSTLLSSKQIQTAKIFLIERGTCLIQNDQLGYRKRENQWAIIGKRQFYFQKIPIYNAFAEQPLSGLQIERTQFLDCVKRFTIEYAKFRQIMDSTLINMHDTYKFGVKCPFCDGYHLHQFCEKLNLWRRYLRIKPNERQTSNHSRIKFIRQGSKSVKCLKHKCHLIEIDRIFHKSEYLKSFNI